MVDTFIANATVDEYVFTPVVDYLLSTHLVPAFDVLCETSWRQDPLV